MLRAGKSREEVLLFLHRFGEVMGNVVLGALYFLLLGPVALVARLLSDPLRAKPPAGSSLVPWRRANETIAAARRQG
ncbi:MAG TPA: hypothetical protein VFD92_16775 [Candidatus Binatia bacterium]|nr:hypothetical protein [Candidatus Binatia bacterium]